MSRARRRADRIREEIPIQRVLADYGFDVDPGYDGEQQFPCDLHGDGIDRMPSARVYPASASWYCFTCDVARDAIQTVRDKEGLDFWPAVRKLEKMYGLSPMYGDEDDEHDRGAAHGATDAVSDLVNPSRTFEDDRERVRKLLDGVTVDRDLPMGDTLKLWEAFDKVCYLARKGILSEANSRIALAKVRQRTIDKVKEAVKG